MQMSAASETEKVDLLEVYNLDMSLSEAEDYAARNSNFYFNEEAEHQKYVEKFVEDSLKYCRAGLNLAYADDQDMSYYQDQYTYYPSALDDQPLLDNPNPADEDNRDGKVDENLDAELRQLLDEVEETFQLKDEHSVLNDEREFCDPRREEFEDYYNEFPESDDPNEKIPEWYEKMLESKVKDATTRLKKLSDIICYSCAKTREKIKRIEQDHGSPFCKLDPPRHPPLSQSWTNYWRFNCVTKCREDPTPNRHAHTPDCETIVLEHAVTGVSTKSKNLLECDYPVYVMDTVELFQEFAIETTMNREYLEQRINTDTAYERPMWSYIKLRSNYKKELLLIACGKGVTSLLKPLQRFFKNDRGRTSNVVSVYCINIKWSQKKGNFPTTYSSGLFELRDKIGPISLSYSPKTNICFNSSEAFQLGKVLCEYIEPEPNTTVLDIGCNCGVLSLMFSYKCEKVIGLSTLEYEIKMAEEAKAFNGIRNASFITCQPKDTGSKISPFVIKCSSVAIINLSSPFGKNKEVLRVLRDSPTIWRVVVYGTFTFLEYKNFLINLTCNNDYMGEPFLPVRGCLLDKSATIKNDYDLVILFEREPLMESPVKLIARGPAMTVKSDFETANHSEDNRIPDRTFSFKSRKGFKTEFKQEFKPAKNHGIKYTKYEVPVRRFGKFDSPLLPIEKEEKPPAPPPRLSPERPLDHSTSREKSPSLSVNAKKPVKERYSVPSVRDELKVKELKKIYDSPSLPTIKGSSTSDHSRHSPPKSSFNYTSVKRERSPEPFAQPTNSQSNSTTRIKRENDVDLPLQIKEEKGLPGTPLRIPIKMEKVDAKKTDNEPKGNDLSTSRIKTEPNHSIKVKEEKEEGELSSDDNEDFLLPPKTIIKPEMKEDDDIQLVEERKHDNRVIVCETISEDSDSNDHVGNKPMKRERIASSENRPVKREPTAASETFVKREIDNLDAFSNMETPVHYPAALSRNISEPVDATCEMNDGFQFTVQSNQSYLPHNSNANESQQRVKVESPEEEEISIIAVKRERSPTTESNVKKETSIEDLRLLLQRKKDIQRKLERRDSKNSNSENKYGHLSRSDSCTRYRRNRDSPPPTRHRSPAATWKSRYGRSPSPSERKYRRSRSPIQRGYRRSRSPVGRWSRGSPSPASAQYRKFSPQPSERRSKRSPSNVDRKCRQRSPPRSNSSDERCARRSPVSSPRERRFKRYPGSPAHGYHGRSPSNTGKWSRYSPVPQSSHQRRSQSSSSLSSSAAYDGRRIGSPITLRRKSASRSRSRSISRSRSRSRSSEWKHEESKRKAWRRESANDEIYRRKTNRSRSKSPGSWRNGGRSGADGRATGARNDDAWNIPAHGAPSLPSEGGSPKAEFARQEPRGSSPPANADLDGA